MTPARWCDSVVGIAFSWCQKKVQDANFTMVFVGDISIAGWWFGTMEFYDFPKYMGISSSQLTNSMIFQRGRYTTNHR